MYTLLTNFEVYHGIAANISKKLVANLLQILCSEYDKYNANTSELHWTSLHNRKKVVFGDRPYHSAYQTISFTPVTIGIHEMTLLLCLKECDIHQVLSYEYNKNACLCILVVIITAS